MYKNRETQLLYENYNHASTKYILLEASQRPKLY